MSTVTNSEFRVYAVWGGLAANYRLKVELQPIAESEISAFASKLSNRLRL